MNIRPEEGFAALDAACSEIATGIVETHSEMGLSVPEQMAIPIDMLAQLICGMPEAGWERALDAVCEALRDNVRNAERAL